MSSREIINVGSFRNDGTGDTPYQAANKINSNFESVWLFLSGDSNTLSGQLTIEGDALVFEGTSSNLFETRLKSSDASQDNIITLPDSSGDVIITSATQTLINKTLTAPLLDLPKIKSGSYSYDITPIGTLSGNIILRIPTLNDSDQIALTKATQTFTNKTLNAATLLNPKISGTLTDVNGADMITFNATGSAVNGINITNATTGNSPIISSVGSNTNVDLTISTKGSGAIVLGSKTSFKGLTVTTASAASLNAPLTVLNSGTPITVTLGDGTTVGENKLFLNSNAGAVTITPASFANGTSIVLKQNGFAEFMWGGANWFLHGDSDNYKSIV
jgi:hypothetical protein